MNEQPDGETRTESNESSLERETRPTDTFNASNGGVAGDNPAGDDAAEDVEIEVVLLSNDEVEGEEPRVLTDNGSSPFRWYMLAPGVLAAGGAAALLLRFRSSQAQNGAGGKGIGLPTSALQGLSGAGSGLGSIAGDQKARARALAAQARTQALAAQAVAMRRKTQARKQKSAWEEAQDSVRTIVSDNLVTIIALTASIGLTIAGRLVDVQREGNLPLPPPPPKKAWYQVGPWSY